MSFGLLILAGFDLTAIYRQAVSQVAQTQGAQVQRVAEGIRNELELVEREMLVVKTLPWEVRGWLTPGDRRAEYQRLLRVLPVVESVRFEGDGGSLVSVFRGKPDLMQAAVQQPASPRRAPSSSVACSYSTIDEPQTFNPILALTIDEPEASGGKTVLEINLRTLAVALSAVLALPARAAYVTDAQGRVVLHRDPGVMAQRLSVADRPHFSAARGGDVGVMESKGLTGGKVLVSWAPVQAVGWWVFIEQPEREALAPVWQAVQRAAAIVIGWLAIVLGLSVYLAKRLTEPINALARGAARLAGGDLGARIVVQRDDELGDLATQFNSMAASLQDTIQNQERRIAEKTHALELANRHKSEFLANMSHELRTPLNAVIGMSEVLAEQEVCGPLNAKQLEYMGDIHASGSHLLALINEILDMSKVESGRMELDLGPCELSAQFAQAAALMRDRAERQGIRLVLDVPPPPFEWTVDAQRFRQIVLNLLSNAVKFTGRGGTVTLRARADAGRLVIEVTDSGRGIAPEHLAHVFEPFRQFGVQPGVPIEGTGLGLALVKRLAELHGGSVALKSEVGQGSTFTVVLPGGAP